MFDGAMASMQTIVYLTNDFYNSRFIVISVMNYDMCYNSQCYELCYDMCYELKYVSTLHVLHVLNEPVRYSTFLPYVHTEYV